MPTSVTLGFFRFALVVRSRVALLLLNYFGQGSLLLRDPSAAVHPLFHMAPAVGAISTDRDRDVGRRHGFSSDHHADRFP